MTLVHMPFTVPLNRSSTELQITRTQWNTECELRTTYGTTLAVANGKLYYLCQNTDKATAESFTYLYIHDSKTGATQGPWRFDGSYRDLRLVYGSAVLDEGEEGPKFGIVESQRGHVAIDLRSAGHARLKLFSVLDKAIVSGNLNAYEFSRSCDESCPMGNSVQRMVIILPTVVVLESEMQRYDSGAFTVTEPPLPTAHQCYRYNPRALKSPSRKTTPENTENGSN
ncbi:hypothetical protein BG006_006094 [Podila minutissima]|uniref:Uncharacterized protein n=1 Tax=Podila minutissima TaxID=64525 RepID=A0A9P5SLK6_9FUNG|nr:hypothetical protein BG006_006094 [Podila minutissima]